MDKLERLRNRIDAIDYTIMELLDERYDLAIDIGQLKMEQSTPVLDQDRENIILEKTSKLSHSLAIKNVYIKIMEESKTLQRK